MKTNFKGTQGKWTYTHKNERCAYVRIETDAVIVIEKIDRHSSWHPSQLEEMEANAKLISKAPELLLMLESIVKDFEMDYVLHGEIVDSPYEWLQDRYKEAKQLIEEATNI